MLKQLKIYDNNTNKKCIYHIVSDNLNKYRHLVSKINITTIMNTVDYARSWTKREAVDIFSERVKKVGSFLKTRFLKLNGPMKTSRESE